VLESVTRIPVFLFIILGSRNAYFQLPILLQLNAQPQYREEQYIISSVKCLEREIKLCKVQIEIK